MKQNYQDKRYTVKYDVFDVIDEFDDKVYIFILVQFSKHRWKLKKLFTETVKNRKTAKVSVRESFYL